MRPTPRPVLATLLGVALLAVAAGPSTAPQPPRPAAPAITPFEDWAPADCPAPTGADALPLERVVVHHTFAPVAETLEEVRPALARICELHTGRGMDTVGYHYVVDPWGGVWQGRGGLPDEQGAPPPAFGEGAHVQGANPGAVGVVFLGDHENHAPSSEALRAASELMAWLLSDTGLDPSDAVLDHSTGGGTANVTGAFEVAAVAGHSASNDTLCPGAELEHLLPELRTGIRRLLAGQQPYDWTTVLDGHARAVHGGDTLGAPVAPAGPGEQREAVTELVVPAPPPPGVVTLGADVVVPAPEPDAPPWAGLPDSVREVARRLLDGITRP